MIGDMAHVPVSKLAWWITKLERDGDEHGIANEMRAALDASQEKPRNPSLGIRWGDAPVTITRVPLTDVRPNG